MLGDDAFEGGGLDGSEWKEEERKLVGAREAICAELRGQSGHDFSGYKTKTSAG
jgi:two-component system CheB/CheR fusion protein